MRLEPWHLLAFVGLVYACASPKRVPPVGVGSGDEPPEPEEPLESVQELYFFCHDRELITPALAAARRIKNATGITVHINEFGTQRTARPIFGSDFLCGGGTEGRSAYYGIAIARDCKYDLEHVILHEIIHQLGVGHLVLPARGVMNEAVDQPLKELTIDDLNALCAVQPCTVLEPEI